MKLVLVWSGILIAHLFAQFVAWSMADAVHSVRGWALAGRILMFPTFEVAGSAADRWFWQSFVINSLLWASVSTTLLRAWLNARRT